MSSEEFRQQEAELDELYRDIIIDHYRHPRHKGRLTAPSASHEGLNPLRGDEVTVEVVLDGTDLGEIGYTGSGCSISQSSASMMAEAVAGKSVAEAHGGQVLARHGSLGGAEFEFTIPAANLSNGEPVSAEVSGSESGLRHS